jgi:hypothetical protein
MIHLRALVPMIDSQLIEKEGSSAPVASDDSDVLSPPSMIDATSARSYDC